MKFSVQGLPVPQGSMKPVRLGGKSDGRIILVSQAGKRLKEWRNMVASEAARHSDDYLYEGAVSVEIFFRMKRAKKPAPMLAQYPIQRPDIDKLARSILDSLTATLFVDDSQVIDLICRKRYGEPGVDVEVLPL